MKTEFNPVLNTKHLIVFKGKTLAQGEVIRSITVNFFKLLVSLNKAETNWRDAKTKKDIKYAIRLTDKSLRFFWYKFAVNVSLTKQKRGIRYERT